MSANTYDELDPNVPCAWCGVDIPHWEHDAHWCENKIKHLPSVASMTGSDPDIKRYVQVDAAELAALREKVAALEAELVEARKDTARLDFLIKRLKRNLPEYPHWDAVVERWFIDLRDDSYRTFRAAVDAMEDFDG